MGGVDIWHPKWGEGSAELHTHPQGVFGTFPKQLIIIVLLKFYPFKCLYSPGTQIITTL